MLRRLWTLPVGLESRGVNIPSLLLNTFGKSSTLPRYYSSDDKSQSPVVPPPGQVFKHERHNMYVCWHPETPFPYEMTKPIDTNAPLHDSHMKIQALTPVREMFRKKHDKLMIAELIKLTYATKHRFYGRYGKKRRDHLSQTDPMKKRHNREYL